MTRSCDILLVADPRFSGGSATALLADAAAFRAQGATLGVALIDSDFFKNAPDCPNPDLLALADHPDTVTVHSGDTIRADIAFLHHPLPFHAGLKDRIAIKADRAVLVAHHPPFRGDGSLEYSPFRVNRTVARAFGLRPLWAPVSGLVRQQLRSFAPFLRLASEDWLNIFYPSEWVATRAPFSDPAAPVLGRHSRPDPLKWPDTHEDIRRSLDGGPDWRVRIMGCLPELTSALPETAELLAFNEEPVATFLNSLDVFAFHHSDRWVEAFGRTIVEAMLMGRPCLLDPRLKGTFGELASYAAPQDVAAALTHLRTNATATRARAASVRDTVATLYGATAVSARLARLRRDTGSVSRLGSKAATPITALRKTIGLMRRQSAGARG